MKQTYEMHLHPEPFESIKAGKQKIETRLYDQKRRQIKVGDHIIFLKRPNSTEQLEVEVVGLSIFKSFQDLFRTIDKAKFGFDREARLEEQISSTRKYYSIEEEKKYGVIGIHLSYPEVAN